MYWSTPPKIDFNRRSQTKLMADAQKAYTVSKDADRVHIPDTLEDLDNDSDSFSRRVKQLTNEDVGQSSKDDQGDSTKQLWFVHAEVRNENVTESAYKKSRRITLPLSYPAVTRGRSVKVAGKMNNL